MTDTPSLAEGYEISADPARIDAERVHRWLSTDAYWALGREREKQDRAIAGSLNFGVYDVASGEQVAYARVVTDRATFAWLCDVYVDPAVRGRVSGPPSSRPYATTCCRSGCAACCSPPTTRTVCTRRSASRRWRSRTSGWRCFSKASKKCRTTSLDLRTCAPHHHRMALRVTFVAAARSSALLAERFEDDRPLDQAGWEEVLRVGGELLPLAAAELRYCSPTPRSRATGDALGYAPLVQLALRDCDMGRWRGLTLGEAMAREPSAVDAWLADPRATPHGGESLLEFVSRVGGWLDTRPVEDGGRIVAVAEPSVIRAALVYALKAPPSTYWNIDVRPLSTTTVTGLGGRWNLRFEGASVQPSRT
ncbi:hypothetical protein SAURM35S_04553 [Streptomyces aurantiogriseus]